MVHHLAALLILIFPLGALADEVPEAPAVAPALVQAEAIAVRPEATPIHLEAGAAGEAFFLRSSDDAFILMPGGRLALDFYGFQGGANQPTNSFVPKRARLELFGTFLKHIDFQLGADLVGSAPIATDIFVNANWTPYANVQLGQFDAPFTMDNRTSDKWSDLVERTNAVRGLGIPEGKMMGAMVWGQPPAKWASWSLGLLNGEGQNVAPNRDSKFDVIGRAWLAPLGLADNARFKNVWVGASIWTGKRAPSIENQVVRSAFKTAAGFTWFSPGTLGTFGDVSKWALELNAPVGPFVFKAEYVHSSEGLRELSGTKAVRTAKLSGSGTYARLSYFAWGDPLINGLGGMQNPPHLMGVLKANKTEDALQFVAQVDHVDLEVTPDDVPATADALMGKRSIDSFGLGANYWYTKHVRFTADFFYNVFGGASKTPRLSGQGAYELTLRAALAL